MANPSICIATILDMSRLSALTQLVEVWPGALAAAVLASSSRNVDVQRGLVSAATRTNRTTLDPGRLRAVLVEDTDYGCPAQFPFNMLRNVALSACTETHVLYLDVDFLPLPAATAHASLLQFAAAAPRRVAVLPAFDWHGSKAAIERASVPRGKPPPRSKRELSSRLSRGELVPFGGVGTSKGSREAWPAGHRCTRVDHWLNSSSATHVSHCDPFYEPYVMLPRDTALPFDESFTGRGFDKVSYAYELFARGDQFATAPGAFVLHRPHAPARTTGCGGAAPQAAHLHSKPDGYPSKNPGETCVQAFLERMASTYNYEPQGAVHEEFRVARLAAGWQCNAARESPRPRPRMWLVELGGQLDVPAAHAAATAAPERVPLVSRLYMYAIGLFGSVTR